mmetsp:Transcript_103013/g.296667  ORF Transcript_103013/g.296667 Transcript_103013/m.296667 type:complete len:223 (-) Transcript_103013:42-710(-)
MHLFQNPDDLTAGRGIGRRTGEEGHEFLAVRIHEEVGAGLLHKAEDRLRRAGLQEATGHAAFERGDGFLHGGHVRVRVRLVGGMGRRLLLADRVRLGHVTLRGRAAVLRRLEVLLRLREAALGGLDRGDHGWAFLLRGGDARLQILLPTFAVAHVFFEEGGFAVGLFLDLLLHGLQQVNNFSDRVQAALEFRRLAHRRQGKAKRDGEATHGDGDRQRRLRLR